VTGKVAPLIYLLTRPKMTAKKRFLPMIGQTISHYRILEKLGGGGMGVVYKAEDTKLGRFVALKFLPEELSEDPHAGERFQREAHAASALNHPHICTIYEVGEADGQTYIAMEYVEGRLLSKAIPPEGLPAEMVLRYGAQIAGALAHAHARGIVHRDLKSSNALITPEGRAKVLDFGLAKRLASSEQDEETRSELSLTEAGAVVGTVPYMAPEVLRGAPADARSDIWALGIILYEMAAGQRPFRGTSGFALSAAILREDLPPLPPHVPAGLRVVTQRCLLKEPGLRYQRAEEACSALEAVASGTGQVHAGLAARPRLGARQLSRGALLGISGALLALLVLVVLSVERWRDHLFGGAAPRHFESLAVLPLENLSHDPAQEYFVDGMTEILITDLAKIGGLKRVISRNSVMQYRNTKKSLEEIARELNVDAVVTGAVMRAGQRVRVTVQVIEAATQRNLWADSYERDMHDVLAMQNEVASGIAQEIHITLTLQERAQLAAASPVSPRAHENYLKGRYYWNKRTPDALKKGLDYFQQAIAEDPGYALAYAGLADSYILLVNLGVLELDVAVPNATAAAKKALELDDKLAEAHASLGIASLYDHLNWRAAEKEFKLAIQLNPNYASAYQWYASTLAIIGRPEELVRNARRAQELDPLSLIINSYLGRAYYLSREYGKAIEQCQKTLEMDQKFPVAHLFLGMAYTQKGRHEEAIAEIRKAVDLSEETPTMVAVLGYAYAAAGERGEALKILRSVLEPAKTKFGSSADTAMIYAGLGEKDQAFKWLERAYGEGSLWTTSLKLDPKLDSLRADPRFADLLRRAGLPTD
jgi:eukaryotic-like serine/threonine-protein kinase